MVIRKGAFPGQHEKRNIDGKDIEAVNEYMHLVCTFTTNTRVMKGVDVLQRKENVLVQSVAKLLLFFYNKNM